MLLVPPVENSMITQPPSIIPVSGELFRDRLYDVFRLTLSGAVFAALAFASNRDCKQVRFLRFRRKPAKRRTSWLNRPGYPRLPLTNLSHYPLTRHFFGNFPRRDAPPS